MSATRNQIEMPDSWVDALAPGAGGKVKFPAPRRTRWRASGMSSRSPACPGASRGSARDFSTQTQTQRPKPMIDMTTQNRAELKALKKQERGLAAEAKTLAANAGRALSKIDRDVRKAQRLAEKNGKRAIAQVVRELKVGKKRLDKTAACVAKRIAILNGRLA